MKPVAEFLEEILVNIHEAGCSCAPVVTLGSPVHASTGTVVAPIDVEHGEDCWLRLKFERVAAAATN